MVLGISIDEDLRRAREFADSMKVSYPLMFDTGSEIGRDYLLQKMPMTILVDRSGVVRYSTSASSAATTAFTLIKYANCCASNDR